MVQMLKNGEENEKYCGTTRFFDFVDSKSDNWLKTKKNSAKISIEILNSVRGVNDAYKE